MRLGRENLETGLIALVLIAVASGVVLGIGRLGWPADVTHVAEFFVETTALTIVLVWVIEVREERRWRGARSQQRRNVAAFATYLANGTYPFSWREERELVPATLIDLHETARALDNNAKLIDGATMSSQDPVRYFGIPLALLQLSWSAKRLRDSSSLQSFVQGDVRRLVDERRDPGLANAAHALEAALDELMVSIKGTDEWIDRYLTGDASGDPYKRVSAYIEDQHPEDGGDAEERVHNLLRAVVIEARAMRDFLKKVRDVLTTLAPPSDGTAAS
jgi:hypothetical protein